MSLTLLLTIGISLIAVAVAAGLTAASRRARPLVLGLGVAALVSGIYLTGILDLTVNGIGSLIAWAQRTVFDSIMAWGVGLAVAGVLALIVGSLLPKQGKEPKPEQPAVSGRPAPAVGAPRPAGANPAAAPAAQPAPGKPTPSAKPAKVDPEDAEIEALLRKRGIM